MIEGVSLLVLLTMVALWMIWAHRGLIKAKGEVYTRWAVVEDVLERRDDLIAALSRAVQGHMGRDAQSGARVERLVKRCREAYGAGDVARAEDELLAEVAELLHVLTLSPGAISDPEAADLPGRIARLDAKADEMAQEYNTAATQLNVLVEAFPSRLAARMYGFGRVDYYEPQKPGTRQRGEWI
ncbi:LemA family protein [Desulfovibrio ferrophilus]|uniref:LemA family protein n=1 Tax=Desulfovibrio ferrophilus TaxID=241368 RepID=A0A2Z6AZK8_9BACT|nr:LemA family protein [Desulfovibrio ferrophilus]BBD08664.1 uncharacterized protein DFE_1938 [Desulfovibrio ferrophilus]